MTELLSRRILSRIDQWQSRIDAGDVAAHVLSERIDELRQLLTRFTALVD